MNFEYNSVKLFTFTHWCQRGVGLALLSLVMACGGGDGDMSIKASTPVPTLTNASNNTAAVKPGASVFLKPSGYTEGTAKITWVDSSGAPQSLAIEAPDNIVQVTPFKTTKYTLEVTYRVAKIEAKWTTVKSAELEVLVDSTIPADVVDLAGEMANARSDHIAIRLPDGRVLVAGGTDGTDTLKGSEVFDPSTEKWTATGDMTASRRGHTATLLGNGKVLVTGGYDGKTALATAEIYDPANETWKATKTPMNTSRRYHTATLLANGKVLIAGGVVGPAQTANAKSTELFDPDNADTSFALTDTPLLEEERQGHTATLVNQTNAQVLFVGNSGVGSAAAKLLTPTAGAASTWISTSEIDAVSQAALPARYNHTAVELEDESVLIIGGFGNAGTSAALYFHKDTTLQTLQKRSWIKDKLTALTNYHTTSGSWFATANLPSSRALHTSTRLLDGRVLVVGGYDGKKSLNTIDIYDPATNAWTSNSKVLTTARAMHTATRLNDGDVLMVGTYFQTSGAISKTSELWRY